MLSIVIPAYNEEMSISETVDKCRQLLSEIGDENSEVIVVDDGSSDKTSEIAKEHGAITIRHPHNIGYGRSLKDGIAIATNDIIVITDADGTYPLDRIPDLLADYHLGFNMVVGARTGKNYDESFFKKINRKILKRLVEYTAGRKIADINSGLRVFSRKEIMPYFKSLCDTFSFTTSMTLAYMMTGKFVKYIPIDYHKRVGKTKVKLLKDALRTLQFIVEAILYYNPLKIFILFSGGLITLSILFFLCSAFLHLNSTFYLGLGSVLLSIIMFGFGLIAVQLKQILSNKEEKQ